MYTLRGALGALDGRRSGSSATSRTRGSPAPTSSPSRKMGAHVTVFGPPTLIPRDIEALGCDVRYDARRACARPTSSTRCACRTSACDGRTARRCASTPPATRSTAGGWARARCSCTRARSTAASSSSGEVVDSPQAVITAQVAAGVVVRMAVLYELLAGARAGTPPPSDLARAARHARGTLHAAGTLVDAPPRHARARTPAVVRGAHVLDPIARIDAPHDVLVRDGEIAEIGAPGSAAGARGRRGRRRHRAATCSRASSTRTCTCAPPARSTRSTSRPARARRPPAASAPSSRCPTPTPVVDSAPLLGALLDGRRARRAHPGRLHGRDHARAGGARPHRDGRAARRGRVRLHRRRQAGRRRRRCCAARCSTSACAGGVLALHEEDPTLSGSGVMHEGEVSARLGVAGIPSVSRVDDGRPRLPRSPATRTARIHLQHLSASAVGRGASLAAKAAGVTGHRRGQRRTTCCSPTRTCCRWTRA